MDWTLVDVCRRLRESACLRTEHLRALSVADVELKPCCCANSSEEQALSTAQGETEIDFAVAVRLLFPSVEA